MDMVDRARLNERSGVAGAVCVLLLRDAALFEQRRIHPVEVQRGQLRQRQIADVATAQVYMPPVPGQRRRAESVALGMIVEPETQ